MEKQIHGFNVFILDAELVGLNWNWGLELDFILRS